MSRGAKVGVLGLQGAIGAHRRVLDRLGATTTVVRTPHELVDVDALVLPGGESTTVAKLLDSGDLRRPLADLLAAGLPVLGTCAGMILLAREVLDGRTDQRGLGVVDVTVQRNAFGRQIDSFEADLDVTWGDALADDAPEGPFPAVFIRAPVIVDAGPDVEVLATVDHRPVLARQGSAVVASFHPELTDDARIHQLFLSIT